MAQRISRAKQSIAASRFRSACPPRPSAPQRLGAVLQALYLIFNEGYSTTSGARAQSTDLSNEAIRLTRMLARASHLTTTEVAGLLALMLLTDAGAPHARGRTASSFRSTNRIARSGTIG